MICKKPFSIRGQVVRCHKCMPCRIHRRRIWTHRIVLESMAHERNSFVTLTYSDEHLPDGGTLVPADLRNFWKRLRKNTGAAIRYYAVGEYGDKSQRPHYHAACFGLDDAAAITRAWQGRGHVYVGTLTWESAGYVAGYVTKKLTKPDDPRLGGRYPEFGRASNRPGIGALTIIAFLRSQPESQLLEVVRRNGGDVPAALSVAGRSLPLGRYLRKVWRKELGLEDVEPEEVYRARIADLGRRWADYRAHCAVAGKTPLSIAEAIAVAARPKVNELEWVEANRRKKREAI